MGVRVSDPTWLAEESARRYITWLGWIREKPTVGDRFRSVVDALVESLDVALRQREELQPSDIEFHAGLLTPELHDEWENLVNPYALGFGDEEAPTIVVGTEEAYDARKLALWNCGGAVLRLCESKPEVFGRLLEGDPEWPDAESAAASKLPARYHRQPMAFAKAPRGRSTWHLVARVMSCEFQEIGLRTYQIDRSAVPAKAASLGLPPDPVRTRWLAESLQRLGATARVLLLHGHIGPLVSPKDENAWDRANREISCAFLGVDALASCQAADAPAHTAMFRAGGRTVIWTGALSGRNRQIVGEYLPALARLVEESGGYTAPPAR